MLREKNGKELANAKFSKVLTTDPHTYQHPEERVRGWGGQGIRWISPLGTAREGGRRRAAGRQSGAPLHGIAG